MNQKFFYFSIILLLISFSKCNMQTSLYDQLRDIQYALPPEIIFTYPFPNEKNIETNDNVIISFSNPMIVSSVENSSNIFITKKDDATTISYSYDYESSTKSITLTPSSILQREATYIATLTTDIVNTDGNSLQKDFSFEFTTRQHPAVTFSSANPGGNPTGIQKEFLFTFSEQIDQNSGWKITIDQYDDVGGQQSSLVIDQDDVGASLGIEWIDGGKKLKVNKNFDTNIKTIIIKMENFDSASYDSAPLNGKNGIQFTKTISI